jgi:protein-S-isoprenylcysteine O-methyltransferase Ste14
MNIIGTSTINPILFYSGKLCGYIAWILLILSLTGTIHLQIIVSPLLTYVLIFCIVTGTIFTITSMINLGKSTRLGLPSEATEFKNNGIYRISRNPMYVGFNLFTIASITGCANVFVALMGVYSIIVYHLIIKSEERFLEQRFGQMYMDYKKKIRRYL